MSERQKWPKPGDTFAPADYGWAVPDAIERDKNLSDFQKRLLLRLMRLAGQRTWCWTTTGWLSEQLGKSRRMVVYAIAHLAAEKYVKRERRGVRGTVFRFLWRAEYQSFQEDRARIEQPVAQFDELRNGLRRNCAMDCAEIEQSIAHLYNTKNTINTNYRERAEQAEGANLPSDGFDATETFNRIWNRHPRKTGRYLAEQAFSEALAEALNPAALAAEIERVHAAWTEAHEWRKEAGRYAPRLDRWLKDRGWLDGPPQAPEEERIIPYRPPWESEEGEEHA
jgi:hypothetical protein